jgi:hypothetical protein
MLLDEQVACIAGDGDTPAGIRESDQEDQLILQLPPHRIFATKAVTSHLRACENIDGRREGVDLRARQGALRENKGVWRAK